MSETKPPDASAYWRAGQQSLKKGDQQRGIALLQHATKLDSGHAGAWLSLGVALAGLGQTGSGAVCLAMATVKAQADSQGRWPDTVGPVAKTNLHSMATKNMLWPTNLASRLSDPSYSNFLVRCLQKHPSLPNSLTLVHSTGLETKTLCTAFPSHTVATVQTSQLMNLVEANMCASCSNKEVVDEMPTPTDSELVVLGSSRFPAVQSSMPASCVPETTVVYGCLVESKDLWDLNFVSVQNLETDTGCSDMSAACEGLKGRSRPVTSYKWGVKQLSEKVEMKEYGSGEGFHGVKTKITVTQKGECAGLLVWTGFRHKGEEYELGPDKEVPHVVQFMLYRDSVVSVDVDDEVGVDVRLDGEQLECTFDEVAPQPITLDSRLPPYHAVMLNDTARTVAYRDGLLQVAEKSSSSSLVLDLGCGTGLLSVLAAKAGFQNVVAVERFQEIADIAEKLITQNELQDSIKLVVKHSTDIVVGEGSDMPKQADVMVHEIFGTDPLSEGFIPAYNEAVRKGLIGKGTVFCPCKFRVWAAVASSESLCRQGGLHNEATSSFIIPRKLEEDVAKIKDVKYHTQPEVVWEVDLTGELLPISGSRSVTLPCTNPSPTAHLVIYWFDFLNGDSALYSTQPTGTPATPVAHWVHNIELLPEGVAPSEEGYGLKMSWAADRVMFSA